MIRKRIELTVILIAVTGLFRVASPAQKTEIVDGVKIIQNDKDGKFGQGLPIIGATPFPWPLAPYLTSQVTP
jgi:hypothetical protein